MPEAAEIVQRGGEVVPRPLHFDLYTKKRRGAVMEALRPKEDKPTGSFLNDAARHAGISPRILKAWLEHGEMYPNGPLGRFNREVLKLIAEANDRIREDIYATANGKKWEGLARIGEQFDPETWQRPSEKGGTTVNVGISITDKLAEVHADTGTKTTGD